MDSAHNPLRILMVCTVETGPSGIPNVIFNLMKAFDRSDMEIGYVSINPIPAPYDDILRQMKVQTYVIPRRVLSSPLYIRRLTQIANRYDVMHVHGNSATMLLELLAAKISKCRVGIAHAHNTSCSARLIHRMARPLFHRLCDGRVGCGEAAGKWLFEGRKFKIVPNAVDSTKFRFNSDIRSSMREKLGVESHHVIGHVGYFMEVKNHSFLIDVFAALNSELTDTCLLLLGDGPLRQSILDKAKSLGIDHKVISVGNVPNPEDYLNAMDAVCMPSLYEGLPLTMIEQQINGLPIVASDRITTEADKTGLVEFLSLEAPISNWVDALRRALNRSVRSLESSLAATEKVKAAGFDISEVARDLKSYYRSCLENSYRH